MLTVQCEKGGEGQNAIAHMLPRALSPAEADVSIFEVENLPDTFRLLQPEDFFPQVELRLMTRMQSYPYLTRLRSITLRVATFTYYGALHHYTIEPIEALTRDQASMKRVKKLLRHFKTQKIEEIQFVQKAVSRRGL